MLWNVKTQPNPVRSGLSFASKSYIQLLPCELSLCKTVASRQGLS